MLGEVGRLVELLWASCRISRVMMSEVITDAISVVIRVIRVISWIDHLSDKGTDHLE